MINQNTYNMKNYLLISRIISNRIFLFVLFAIITLDTNAQREGDSFALGYCDFMFSHGCIEPFGSAIYKFNELGIEDIIEPAGLNLNTSYSRAAFSDRHSGDLIFASNGWRLVNRQGQVLSYKLWRSDFEAPHNFNDTANLLYTHNPLFLPDPGDSTKAYLFYGQYQTWFWTGQGPRWNDIVFTYAYLDIPSQSLISQNNVLISDTTAIGGIGAVRHANGRDWWIVKPGRYQDEFFVGLLTPQGINFEKRIFPEIEHLEQARPCSYFSQMGDVFVNATGFPHRILRFDFDRCSGLLSNYELHSVIDSVWSGDWMAPALSPDGSKFYFRRSSFPYGTQGTGGLFQYDFDSELIYKITDISSNPQLTSNYNQMLLSSRFFNENDSMIRTLSTINEPDKIGLECNLVLNTDTILNIANFLSPSAIVNFRLGKIAGSPCDTVVSSVNQVVEKEAHIQLYPNPTRDIVYLDFPYPNGKAYQIQIIDAMGKLVYLGKFPTEGGSLNIASLGFANGLYVLHAQRDGKGYSRRFLYER